MPLALTLLPDSATTQLNPGTFLAVVVASLPDRSLPMLGKAVLGCIVALGCWGLFIELLNLPFKPFIGFW